MLIAIAHVHWLYYCRYIVLFFYSCLNVFIHSLHFQVQMKISEHTYLIRSILICARSTLVEAYHEQCCGTVLFLHCERADEAIHPLFCLPFLPYSLFFSFALFFLVLFFVGPRVSLNTHPMSQFYHLALERKSQTILGVIFLYIYTTK